MSWIIMLLWYQLFGGCRIEATMAAKKHENIFFSSYISGGGVCDSLQLMVSLHSGRDLLCDRIETTKFDSLSILTDRCIDWGDGSRRVGLDYYWGDSLSIRSFYVPTAISKQKPKLTKGLSSTSP